MDSDALIEAAESERAYASAEGQAALYCLLVWARSKVFQGAKPAQAVSRPDGCSVSRPRSSAIFSAASSTGVTAAARRL